jgi:hypothetical protein
MLLQLADPDFKYSALAIGLKMVDHEEKVARGEHDSLVIELGNWIRSLGRRPVFLRIGYEFDGHDWNHYNREDYISAFRRIRNIYDSLSIDNIAYVWQSCGWGSSYADLENWYPGDDYVDWCSYSHFARGDEAPPMIDFARDRGKPVFISEASPTLPTATVKTDGQTKPNDLADPDQAKEAWEKWFVPFFKSIRDNPDIIKAISYINCHWKDNPMWFDNPTFQYVDAALQLSPEISKKWKKEISKEGYLNASPELFDQLWNNARSLQE